VASVSSVPATEAERSVKTGNSGLWLWLSAEDGGVIASSGFMNVKLKRDEYTLPGVDRKESEGECSSLRFGTFGEAF